MNLGKYEAGNQNILSYDKNGNQATGIYKYADHRNYLLMHNQLINTNSFPAPMPDFRSTSVLFDNTIVGDSQIIATAKHIGAGQPKNFVDRYRRTDISNLYQNYSTDVNNSTLFLNKFSEDYGNSTNFKVNYSTNSSDFSILRNNKVMVDAIPYEILPQDRYDEVLEYGTLVARAGHGNIYINNGKSSTQDLSILNGKAGGYTRINSLDYLTLNKNQNISIKIKKDSTTDSFKTPLDNSTAGSDSGSLILLWDEKYEKWYFGGVVLGGDVLGGTGNYSNDNKFTLDLIKNYNKEINETSKTLTTNDFIDQKNHIYTNGISLNISSNTNTNFARLIFKENSSISGNATLTTAGIEVEKDKNLNFNLDLNGSVIRKIGEGTLTIKSNSNKGQYSIGDGVLSLENDGKVASKILIASGRATVKLNKDNQLDNTEFVFGLSGGKLDLNSHNQTFNDIYHMDKGAKIINSDNQSKSTFTFNPNGDRVFLGEFNGNLDVIYDSNSTWELRNRNSNLKDLNIQKGTIFIKGDNMLGGTNNLTTVVVKDMFYENKFNSENINISNNSTLKLGRTVKLNSKINVFDNGKINIEATGKILTDAKKMTLNEEENYQENINKIVIEKDINFKNGDNTNLTINLENNNIAVINGDILGKLNAEKTGSGILYINSNNIENGNLSINDGIVTIKNINQAKNLNYSFDNFSILRLENTNSNDLGNVLNKIDTNSKGIVSIDNDLDDISTLTALNNLDNIFLGTNKNITIGSDTLDFSKGISKLRLGGDGGTITIKGINNVSNILDLIIGTNEKNLGGKVIVKDDIQGTNVFVTVNNGVTYEGTTKNIVTLNYGASGNTRLSNISESSEGIYLTNDSNNDLSNYNNLYIGTNKELELNSLIVKDKYLLSSIDNGNLKINFKLDKDTIIDAQGYSNGIVTINKETENNIEVLGNKENQTGNITLKLGIDNAIKNLTLKSGSILNLNDKSNSIKFIETSPNSVISGNGNLKILDDINKNTIINSEIKGSSKILFENSGSLLLNNISNDFSGSITIKDDAKYILNKNNNYTIKFTGFNSNNNSLELLDNVSIVSNIELEKDIISKSNNKTLKYSNIKFNNHLLTLKDQTFEIENITQNDKIKLDNSKYLLKDIVPNISGYGIIENVGKKVTLNNLSNFSGTIIAKSNDIEVSNISNTTLKSENNNILLNTDENFSNLNIFGNLILKGNNKFENDLPNLDNVSRLTLNKGYSIKINKNLSTKNLENNGIIYIDNNKILELENYTGNGILELNINKETNDILKIKNSDEIKTNITFDKDTSDYLLNNKILLGNIKNLNILNINNLKYNNLELNNNNGTLSYIVKSNILNEYILLKNIFKLNDLSYSNLISKNSLAFDISYIHTNEFSNETLNNFTNTNIKSNSNTFGINLNANKSFKYANIYTNLSYMFTNIKTISNNKDFKNIDTHTFLLSSITKLGLENYGSGIILNLNSTLSENKYISIDTGILGYFNHEFKLNNINLLLKNELNILRHNQIYYKSNEDNNLNILTPYKLSYLFGTKLNYNKYTFDINTNFSYDFSKIKISNNIEKYNFITGFDFKLDSSLKYKINNNFNLKFDNILNIAQKHLIFKTSFGFEYMY